MKTPKELIEERVDEARRSASLDIDLQEAISELKDRVVQHYTTRKQNNSFTGPKGVQQRKLAKIIKFLDAAYTETISIGW